MLDKLPSFDQSRVDPLLELGEVDEDLVRDGAEVLN